jgi:uncharacterized protein (TIGR00255 family)
LYFDQLGDESNTSINGPVVKNYYQQLLEVYSDLGIEVTENTMQAVLRMPDAIKTEHEEIDEEEWAAIVNCINEALEQHDRFRQQEGAALHADVLEQVKTIQKLKDEVAPFESERIEMVKTRLTDALKELKNNLQNDENRFEQELIFYLEKLDINEEKVRLDNHCKYFLETLEDNAPGKKLAFISQEIGREINTMGSKANHAEIQKLVIRMKEALEKIKEQSLNIL